MSVMPLECESELESTSSPVLASYFATFPFSWPAMIKSESGAQRATVALEPEMIISLRGADDDAAGSSRLILNVLAVSWWRGGSQLT